MEFTIHIPTFAQLGSFQAWDAGIGIFLAIALAVFVGIYFVGAQLIGIWPGARGPNATWMFMNIIIGAVLSVIAMSLSGSWLVGCGVAVALFFILGFIRESLERS